MQEQRLTKRLFKYWDLLRKTNAYPDIRHFNPAAVEDIWPHCFMVSIHARAQIMYQYEYMGEDIVLMYGRDLTGDYVSHRVKQFPAGIMFRRLGELVKGHRPKEDMGHFINDNGKMVKYRACFLPFGKDNTKITHVVVGLTYRIY